MGVIFVDSFDHYPTAYIGQKWTGKTNPGSTASISGSASRNGSGGLRFTTTSGSSSIDYVVTPKYATGSTNVVIGFAIRFNAFPTGTSVGNNFFAIGTVSSGTMNSDCVFWINPSGQILINNGATTTSNGWIGPSNLTTGTWYYIQITAKCLTGSTSALGDITVAIDYGTGGGMQTVLQLKASQQTSGSSTFQAVAIGRSAGSIGTVSWPTSTAVIDVDDFYWLDQNTGVHTSGLGNCKVECLFPDSAGASSQWTPSTGVSNYACVDASSYNAGSTYVSTAGTGNRDTYEFNPLSSTPTSIYAVQETTAGWDDAAGSRTMLQSLYISSTYYDTASITITNTGYAMTSNVWENNPNTSAAFTMSDITSLEAGIKLVT